MRFGKNTDSQDITTAQEDDEDVITEQNRVLAGQANNDLIVVSELTKKYDNGKIAVNNMSLGIPPGECFGLLGINGAGESDSVFFLRLQILEYPNVS
jgi:ATP-binding cassette, subfamily A (ABC1), member 3